MGDFVILLEKIQNLAKNKRFTVLVIILMIIQGIVSNLSFCFTYKHVETYIEEDSTSGVRSEKKESDSLVLRIETNANNGSKSK